MLDRLTLPWYKRPMKTTEQLRNDYRNARAQAMAMTGVSKEVFDTAVEQVIEENSYTKTALGYVLAALEVKAEYESQYAEPSEEELHHMTMAKEQDAWERAMEAKFSAMWEGA